MNANDKKDLLEYRASNKILARVDVSIKNRTVEVTKNLNRDNGAHKMIEYIKFKFGVINSEFKRPRNGQQNIILHLKE